MNLKNGEQISEKNEKKDKAKDKAKNPKWKFPKRKNQSAKLFFFSIIFSLAFSVFKAFNDYYGVSEGLVKPGEAGSNGLTLSGIISYIVCIVLVIIVGVATKIWEKKPMEEQSDYFDIDKNNKIKMIDKLPDKHKWKQEKDPNTDEWIVRVDWKKTVKENEAVPNKDNPFPYINNVCQLNKNTLDYLREEFNIDTNI